MPQKKNQHTTRIRRSERKNIAVGQAHIKSTFNNTIISITDPAGNVIAWQSGGTVGFKGSACCAPRGVVVSDGGERPAWPGRRSGWAKLAAVWPWGTLRLGGSSRDIVRTV